MSMLPISQETKDLQAWFALEDIVRLARNNKEYKHLLPKFKSIVKESPTVMEYIRNLTKDLK